MSLVLSLTLERTSSTSKLNPESSFSSIGIALAPENSIAERYIGKPGSGYMISTPGSPNINMAKNIVGLPPGTTMMRSGATSAPLRANMSLAMASRNSGMPAAGV